MKMGRNDIAKLRIPVRLIVVNAISGVRPFSGEVRMYTKNMHSGT